MGSEDSTIWGKKKGMKETKNNNEKLEDGPQDKAKAPRKKEEKKSKKIKEWESLLKEKEEEAEKNYDQMLRAMAELENNKKRAAKEKSDLLKYGNEQLVREIIPVLDNLERATEHAKSPENYSELLEGIRMTIKQFHSVLDKFGVETIVSFEKKFDPEIHEAVMQIESENHEPGTVVTELQKGYLLNGRLIRAARVAVSKPTDKKESRPS